MKKMPMIIYLQTRGKNTDYAFLGGAPSQLWWQEFRDDTSFEQPTIITKGDRSKWRCFVSGIPSERRDRVGTVIRYTLVLEGECCKASEEVLSLVSAWLKNARAGGLGKDVQAAMDGVFDEATVERLLSNRNSTPESLAEVGRLVAEGLSKLPHPEQRTKPLAVESWVGSATSVRGQKELLARSAELFRGERKGVAALLNLLGTVGDATNLLEKQSGSLAVLIRDTTDKLGDEIVELKKKPFPPKPDPSPKIPLGTWILLVLVAVALLWALLSTNHTAQRFPPQDPSIQR